MYDFSNKTALVTGASSGLGEQFVRCLNKAGARVILAARRLDRLMEIAASLDNTVVVRMDVADQDSVKCTFKTLEEAGEKIDICINNAGIAALTPIFEEDPKQDFEAIIQTNVMGVWYVSKAVAQHMRKQHIHGAIINIGSINGDGVPAQGGSAYSVSKAAVMHLTKTLVGELSPYSIRVNCIAPGWFRTPMNGPDVDKITPHIPHGNIAEPNNLDGLILYLASDKASSYVTGACFTIDGGMSWGGRSW